MDNIDHKFHELLIALKFSVVTVCTTCVNNNSAFCPQNVFDGFMSFSEYTAIICLNNTNQLLVIVNYSLCSKD
jgi:hypothetical protein